jgi:hypothetical protein
MDDTVVDTVGVADEVVDDVDAVDAVVVDVGTMVSDDVTVVEDPVLDSVVGVAAPIAQKNPDWLTWTPRTSPVPRRFNTVPQPST